MAFQHGKDTALQVDNTAGSLTNVGLYTDNVDGLPGEVELSDVTTFGQEGHRNIPGLENASFTISGPYDPAVSTAVGSNAQRKTATRTFEYGPAGSGSGAIKLTGECWIQTFTISSAVGEKATWSATCQVDGEVSATTYA